MNYRHVKQTLFVDPEYQNLSARAGHLFLLLRLMATNIIALYRPDWETIDTLLGCTRDERESALSELAVKPWVKAERGYVWIVNGFKYELGERNGSRSPATTIHVAAVSNSLDSLPTWLTLRGQFVQRYINSGLGDNLDTLLGSITVQPPVQPEDTDTGSEADSGTEAEAEKDLSASATPDATRDEPSRATPRTRALTAQQQAVKDCLDAFGLGYAEVFGKPYPGNLNEKAGRVAKWLKGQLLPGAVLEWIQAAQIAVKAFKLDPTFHPFPSTVPKFCEAVPKLNGAWLDSARANAAKSSERGGSVGSHEATMTARARTCLRDNPGCGGGSAAACGYCARTVAGSKR
jgi:hypothetical protein